MTSFSRRSLGVEKYWSSDRGLTALLVSLALLVFVVLPLETSGLIGPVWFYLVDVWLAGVILAGATALGWHTLRRGLLGLGLAVVAAMAGLRLLARSVPARWTETTASLTSALVVSALVALILAQVLREGPTNRHRIYGAVAAYLLLGLDWAFGFRLVDVLLPGSFHGLAWAPEAHNLSSFVYFSFCTLTTAGYGDIVPVTLPARSLANVESLVGQLFPAVLLARLVGMSVTRRPPA